MVVFGALSMCLWMWVMWGVLCFGVVFWGVIYFGCFWSVFKEGLDLELGDKLWGCCNLCSSYWGNTTKTIKWVSLLTGFPPKVFQGHNLQAGIPQKKILVRSPGHISIKTIIYVYLCLYIFIRVYGCIYWIIYLYIFIFICLCLFIYVVRCLKIIFEQCSYF